MGRPKKKTKTILAVGTDPVHSPKHYNVGTIECIEFIEDQEFDFHLGNAVKYITRSRHKGTYVQDLEKAIWYLRRTIELTEENPRRPNAMTEKEEG